MWICRKRWGCGGGAVGGGGDIGDGRIVGGNDVVMEGVVVIRSRGVRKGSVDGGAMLDLSEEVELSEEEVYRKNCCRCLEELYE
jgi:hypothetical protein